MASQELDEDECTHIFRRGVVFAVSSRSADARHRYVALTVPALVEEVSAVRPLPSLLRLLGAVMVLSSLTVIGLAVLIALHAPR